MFLPLEKHTILDLVKQLDKVYDKLDVFEKQRTKENELTCPDCQCETFRIQGYTLDRDGIRDARFCPECKTVLRLTCSSFQPYLVMKDKYGAMAKQRIIYALKTAIKELEYDEPKEKE